MVNVGGDPGEMTGGASVLHGAGTTIRDLRREVDGAGSKAADSAGEPDLAAAIARLTGALAASVHDSGVQTLLAGQLAASAAADLRNATGGG